MPNSLPGPPLPPPPPPPPAAPSKSRFHTCKNSSQGLQKMSVSNRLPSKDKRTRDLPNLSDCHGCGVRINYSNPEERLQPLESFWRIALLCKKCIKMVNYGKLCPYCFRDTVNLVSDCVRCSDCERFIHQNCIVNYSGSPPWSYSCKESGLGFSVCVDCWVPQLLKNSVRVCMRKEIPGKSGEELSANQCDSRVSMKEKDEVKSLEKVIKDANSVMEKKIAVAVKAKEMALRKLVVAKNAALLAGNSLDLVAKECGSKKSEDLVASINNGSSVNEVPRFVDDAELAFQLHRAMNSSPRISRNTCLTNHSCSDLLKLTDSCSVSPNLNGLGSGEDGKVEVCNNTLMKGNRDSNIVEASACISCSAVSPHGLKPELVTYQRNNKKWKQENVEKSCVGTYFGVDGKCTAVDGCKIVTSSPRISKNACSTNLSWPDLLKLTDSCSVTPKLNYLGSGEDGKVAVCSNTLMKGNNDSNIVEASVCIRTNESSSAVSLHGLKPELMTFQRNNKKRMQEDVENGCVGTSFGVDGKCTAVDGGKTVSSSPRISKNICSANSWSDLLKLTDSCSVSPKLNDIGSGEDGKVAVCSNTFMKGNHDSNVVEASACIRTNESRSAVSPHGLEPELKAYQRNNKKRKQENVEKFCVGTSFDVDGKCAAVDGSKIVTEPQSCQLDELRQVFVNDARTSSPESCNTNSVTESRCNNRRPDRYAIKYKRITGCKMDSNEEIYFRHDEFNFDSVSFQKQTHSLAPGLPMDCSVECEALSNSSSQSSVVNLQASASIDVSNQEEV